MYATKLGAFLAANHPGKTAYAHDDGRGTISLQDWDDKSDGAAPTPEEVAAWTPTPPDPDKAPAPSLEIGDYKTLDAALEAASTVAQVKAVFRQYLRRRAGL